MDAGIQTARAFQGLTELPSFSHCVQRPTLFLVGLLPAERRQRVASRDDLEPDHKTDLEPFLDRSRMSAFCVWRFLDFQLHPEPQGLNPTTLFLVHSCSAVWDFKATKSERVKRERVFVSHTYTRQS